MKRLFTLALILVTVNVVGQQNTFSKTNDNNADGKIKGFTNITEFYFEYGWKFTHQLSPEKKNIGFDLIQINYGLHSTFGYQFNRYYSIGLGLGLENEASWGIQLPVFLENRICFLKGKVTPFLSLAAGYRFSLFTMHHGGILASPSLGIKFFVSPKTALNLSIGYILSEDQYDYVYNHPPYSYRNEKYKWVEHGINVKLGLTF
jgi:hypothetical protein